MEALKAKTKTEKVFEVEAEVNQSVVLTKDKRVLVFGLTFQEMNPSEDLAIDEEGSIRVEDYDSAPKRAAGKISDGHNERRDHLVAFIILAVQTRSVSSLHPCRHFQLPPQFY